MDADTWIPLIVAVVSGGALVAAIQAVTEPMRIRQEHRLQLKEKRESARFDDERRRLTDHLEARNKYLGQLEDLLRWANSIAAQTLQSDTDYFDPEGSVRKPLDVLPTHLADLRRLSVHHPARRVRTAARTLDTELRGFYGDMTRRAYEDEFPHPSDRDRLLRFIDEIEELVESVHDPERDPGADS